MKTALLVLVLVWGRAAAAQDRYPVVPGQLPDSAEIALALTAAPAEITSRASVWGIRAGRETRLRQGTSQVACMLGRDLHQGSRYPICFDAEGARTRLKRELMELRLRLAGDAEPDIRRKVEEAYRTGALEMPRAMSVAYMMSPGQVLFSSPLADGRRVGPWWPHLMIMGPGLSARNLGLADSSTVTAFMVGTVGAGHESELIVKLPAWSDGTPVKP